MRIRVTIDEVKGDQTKPNQRQIFLQEVDVDSIIPIVLAVNFNSAEYTAPPRDRDNEFKGQDDA